jgi:hypothetical protein
VSWPKDHSEPFQSAWHAFRVYLHFVIITFLPSAVWAVGAALVSVTRKQVKRVLACRDDRSLGWSILLLRWSRPTVRCGLASAVLSDQVGR